MAGAAAVAAVADGVPVAFPFLAPSEGAAANRADFGGEAGSFDAAHLGMQMRGGRGSGDFFGDGFGLDEPEEVVGATGFGVGTGHIETAEGLGADHGAGAFAVEVEVADVEAVGGELEAGGVGGVGGAGEAVLAIVGEFEGVFEVARGGDGEDGAEDFLLEDAGGGGDIGDDGGLKEVAVAWRGAAAGDEAAFLLADFDVFEDGFAGAFVDDGAHVIGGVLGGSDAEGLGEIDDAVEDGAVDLLVEDEAGAG